MSCLQHKHDFLLKGGGKVKGYLSVREASYKWGVSERRVNQYCTQGRIPGLSRFGKSWCIPENAEKPTDPRKNRDRKENSHF